MVQHAKQSDLGFIVADAEDLTFSFDLDGRLTLEFIDWQQNQIKVIFKDVIGFRFQEAEYYSDEKNERLNGTYIIQESRWLSEHQSQGACSASETYYHYKMNFNAAGICEVLSSSFEVAAN